jgi:hypothetical protein
MRVGGVLESRVRPQIHLGKAWLRGVAETNINHDPDARAVHRRIGLDAESAIFQFFADTVDLHAFAIEDNGIVERDGADFPEGAHHIGCIGIAEAQQVLLADHPHLTLTGLYNVLEKLRSGTKPDEFDEAYRKTFDEGLVLILKELHDKLDVAVAEAYGWPADLSDDEMLARLVALNKERAAEEKRGLVRWLRPDYQIPRFAKGVDKQAAKEEGTQVAAELIAPVEQKPSFPTGAVEQTAAVFAALAAASGPLDAKALAALFKRTKTTEKKVGEVLASLARLGYVTSEDGKAFALRRVA